MSDKQQQAQEMVDELLVDDDLLHAFITKLAGENGAVDIAVFEKGNVPGAAYLRASVAVSAGSDIRATITDPHRWLDSTHIQRLIEVRDINDKETRHDLLELSAALSRMHRKDNLAYLPIIMGLAKQLAFGRPITRLLPEDRSDTGPGTLACGEPIIALARCLSVVSWDGGDTWYDVFPLIVRGAEVSFAKAKEVGCAPISFPYHATAALE